MSLLQIQIDEKLKKAIQKKAKSYDIPVSSLIKIVLAQSFLIQKSKSHFNTGNIFNADRDAGGKGIPLDGLISAL